MLITSVFFINKLPARFLATKSIIEILEIFVRQTKLLKL